MDRLENPSLQPASICILASGSRGNAVYIASGGARVLVDAGLSGKEIERRMQMRGLSATDLDGIIVSHEHADHIHGVGVLARRFRLPVYMTPGTGRAAAPRLGKVADIRLFSTGTPFRIREMTVRPFAMSHDAEEPTGFTFAHRDRKIGLATDLGAATALVREQLKGCGMLILEANHDPEMLENGPYPWPLKQRIKSRLGHLSNAASCDLLAALISDRLRHVVLAHLSETNNTPEIALRTICPPLNGHRIAIHMACQDMPTPILDY